MYSSWSIESSDEENESKKSLNFDKLVSRKSSKEETDQDTIPVVDERIGSFLSSTPPVIEKLFQNLGAKDLNQCAKVCSTWSKIAQTEKQKRLSPFTYFLTLDKKVDPEKTDFVCKFVSEFPQHLDTALNNCFIEPNLVLIFTCSFLSKKKNRVNDVAAVRWILGKLPKQCSVLCLSSHGVVGTPMNKIWPCESEKKSAISGLFFPKSIPGVEFYPFEIPVNLKRTLDGPKKLLKWDEIFNITGVPQNKSVKCLLLFTNFLPREYRCTGRESTVCIADYFLKGCNYQIAVGGGVADAISYKASQWYTGKSCSIGAGLAIAGDVNAASVLIPMHTKSKDEILDKLKELRNGITLKNCSMAFLFPCCARGSDYFDEKDVEPTLFNQVFPGVRLVGMFGNGEFGIDYFPNKTITIAPTEKQTFIHCYTSVFVILSWNEK